MDMKGLERQKLEAEIQEIHSRIEAQRFEKIKTYPTYLTVIVSVLVAVGTYVYQYQQLLYQQAKDQQLKVTKEMVDLVRLLADRENVELQQNAALGLSSYGNDAAPLLVQNLQIEYRYGVYDAITYSLEAIALRAKDASPVGQLLIESADKVLTQQLGEESPKFFLIRSQIQALVDFHYFLRWTQHLNNSTKIGCDIKTTLARYVPEVERAKLEKFETERVELVKRMKAVTSSDWPDSSKCRQGTGQRR